MPTLGDGDLTQQCDDAAQNSQKGAGAQARCRVGHSSTGQGYAVRVTVAHTHRQRVCAAEGRASAVHDQHWQPVNRLLPPPEAASLRQDGRCVVCETECEEKG